MFNLYEKINNILFEHKKCYCSGQSVYPHVSNDCKIFKQLADALKDYEASFTAGAKIKSDTVNEGGASPQDDRENSPPTKESNSESSSRQDTSSQNSAGSPKSNDEPFNWKRIAAGITAVVALFVAVGCFQDSNTAVVIDPRPAWKESFQENLLHLEKPKMSENDYSAISAAGDKWLDGGEKPTVLTLAGEGAGNFGLKLLESLNAIVGNTENVKIQARRDHIRQEIDDEVSEALRSVRKNPAVLVTNIEDLVWDSPMFIYIFADDDHFPISNALIILTIEKKIDGKCTRGIRKVLQTSWLASADTETEDREKIEPAISRIVPFVACF